MKLLFVDDEPDTLEQAKIFLERGNGGLSVETAVSAEKGLELLDEGGFDAVVSDYRMPGMDGLDFLLAIRERKEDVPFIMVTGKGSRNTAERALKIGSKVYFEKKGSPREFFQMIGNTVVRIIEDREDRKTGDNLIAWIEVGKATDTTEFERDLEELSFATGFRIMDIDVQKNPIGSSSNRIIRVYTDSYPEVPESMGYEAKKWKGKLRWDKRVVDVDVRIEGQEERDKTRILGEIEGVI